MKVVIVGNDLRSVALAKALRKEQHTVICIPGVPNIYLHGIAKAPLNAYDSEHLPAWQLMRNKDAIVASVLGQQPDLVICLHVESSDAGVVDALLEATGDSVAVFGPRQQAARLECSKTHGIEIARKAGLNVPLSVTIPANERPLGRQMVLPGHGPFVVKADGLAGGRGTAFAASQEEAFRAANRLPPGDIIVQQFIPGREFALSLLCLGRTIKFLNINFEYKRALEGDKGPNTPGMGTVARNSVGESILLPLLRGLPDLLGDVNYSGPLDVSFMIHELTGEPYFLEFTARFGDPELASELLLLTDIGTTLFAMSRGIGIPVTFRSSLWSMGAVVKGEIDTSLVDDEDFTSETAVLAGETVTCFSLAGIDLDAVVRSMYGVLKSAAGNSARYREDLGHDADERWRALCGLLRNEVART